MTSKSLNIIESSWHETSKKLLKFILSKVQQKEDAEDILQDVYIKTISKVDELKPDTNLNAWLFAVTKNAINDYFRTKQKLHEVPFQETLSIESSNAQADEEGFCCLYPHIQELPEKYKNVILLSEIQGKKHQEIANELNLSLSAIKSRVVRGRDLLKEKFISCCHYHLDKNGKLTGEVDCENPNCIESNS